MKKLIYLFLTFSTVDLSSQEIPQDFFEYSLLKIYNNSISKNHQNSFFGPLRLPDYGLDSVTDSILSKSNLLLNKEGGFYRIGFDINNTAKKIFAYYRFIFQENFYFYFYPRIVTNTNSFNNFSGVPLKNKRLGFNSGEVDISGIGYKNDWIFIQLGRGRQAWGFGDDIQLGLSQSSNNYDHFVMEFNNRNFTSRYFHGYLETLPDNINRFIVGKGIKYEMKNMQLGFAEIIIYSGENRSLDFSYFNPLASHIEIEYNNRHIGYNKNSGNAIWQFSADFFSNNKFRISSNFIIDELTLDESEDGSRASHRYAFSTKGIYNFNLNDNILNIHLSFLFSSKNAFRHQEGSNNFIQRGKPLGSLYGSDFTNYNILLEYYNKNNVAAEIKAGRFIQGHSSTIMSPYMNDYSKLKILQEIDENFISSKVNWYLKSNMSIYNKMQIIFDKNEVSNVKVLIGLNLFIHG